MRRRRLRHRLPAFETAQRRTRLQGVVLVVALLVLIIISLLSFSAATQAWHAQQAARAERDRYVAFLAADAALNDAEIDIDPPAGGARAALFPVEAELTSKSECGRGIGVPNQGICSATTASASPWLLLNLADAGDAGVSVEFGRFTGKPLLKGLAAFSSKAPRYLIEALPDPQAKPLGTTRRRLVYRVTAIGFGFDHATRIVLQTVYRKSSQREHSRRLSWRAVNNYEELRDAVVRRTS